MNVDERADCDRRAEVIIQALCVRSVAASDENGADMVE